MSIVGFNSFTEAERITFQNFGIYIKNIICLIPSKGLFRLTHSYIPMQINKMSSL